MNKFEEEIERYRLQVKKILPIEKKINMLKKKKLSPEEIKKELGTDANIFEYVPNVLYHGSPKDFNIINSGESTQPGSVVYATDDPVNALFFSVFRNSSESRAHIKEYIDSNGEYKVKYIIDERIKGAVEKLITDKIITIYVCDGKQFTKPRGSMYIEREWVSKKGQNIIPVDKIQINVKDFLKSLEKQGLLEYSPYDKSKDWITVIEMLAENYPFGLNTERGKSIEKYDATYDEFIEKNFPEQLNFSKKFRLFVQKTMARDFKAETPNMTSEEEVEYKLKYIINKAYSFLNTQKNKNGETYLIPNIEEIESFCNSERIHR